ncbi:hypothetical protein ACP70R_026061 [Stipagrostis hirtigluma subsp. patula]
MSRRFLNMIMDKYVCDRLAFSLHRINPWRCFYPTTAQALEAASAASNKAAMEDARLSRAVISFYNPCPPVGVGEMEFMSLGCSSNDIISMDQDGNTLLYDPATRAIRVMPAPHAPKEAPVSLAMGDTLYLLDRNPGPQEAHPFEALVYSRPRPNMGCYNEKWYWRSLPPPPFANEYPCGREVEEEEEDSSHCHQNGDPYVIRAYTVVGESQIWISTVGGGTFSFNTMTGVWSKAGDWALPFYGRVEYAPEHGLWFGFSSEGWQFAASDLGVASAARPPVLQKVWNDLVPPLPKCWVPFEPYLLPLGSGKFCIARIFNRAEEGWSQEKHGKLYNNLETFAVLTGVEVESGSRGALRMIKHKSRRYSFGDVTMVQPL